jgi:hypothetical protein
MAVDCSTNACIGCRRRKHRARRTSTGSTARTGTEPCKIRVWRWSVQNRTYESTGEELDIQRLKGSRFNFAWSNESERLVVINARGTNEAECAFFQVEGTFRELGDRSRLLTDKKIVALAFATYHSGMAAVSVDPEKPALRRASLFKFSDDNFEIIPIKEKDSIPLSEGFLPNGIAFGPGNEITLTSWNSVRTLDLRDGKVTAVRPPTFRDQFMRLVVGPGNYATRLVATSLYGRVHVARCAQARAGRARGLPRLNGNSTVQFGWPTIADFIRRNVECVRQPAPHRRQSVVSAAGGCT